MHCAGTMIVLEHAWIRTRVSKVLCSAMDRYGLGALTKILVSTSRGWLDVCGLARVEFGAGPGLEYSTVGPCGRWMCVQVPTSARPSAISFRS